MASSTVWWRAALGLKDDDPFPAARLAVIALVAGGTAGAFGWAAGWASPGRLGPATLADALQNNTGQVFPGFRRAHAKGLCVMGSFQGNGQGQSLSKAAVFGSGQVPVIGRFSIGGGNPFARDGQVVFHALALEFRLPDGTQWRMAIDDTPIFPVSTPEAFMALQRATIPDPATHRPDPAKVGRYLEIHPETKPFLAWMKQAPLPSSFANSAYNSINTFRFTNASGESRRVRWSLQPDAPPGSVDKSTLATRDANFLFKEFTARVAGAPQRWRMVITVAGPGDLSDATTQWAASDQQVEVGTLTLNRAVPEDEAAAGPDGCRDVNFDPLTLPAGISASDDKLLPVRSAVYSVSYRRRAVEGPGQSEMDKLAGQNGENAR
jgi:catalase